jgi:hypothetical protein
MIAGFAIATRPPVPLGLVAIGIILIFLASLALPLALNFTTEKFTRPARPQLLSS